MRQRFLSALTRSPCRSRRRRRRTPATPRATLYTRALDQERAVRDESNEADAAARCDALVAALRADRPAVSGQRLLRQRALAGRAICRSSPRALRREADRKTAQRAARHAEARISGQHLCAPGARGASRVEPGRAATPYPPRRVRRRAPTPPPASDAGAKATVDRCEADALPATAQAARSS